MSEELPALKICRARRPLVPSEVVDWLSYSGRSRKMAKPCEVAVPLSVMYASSSQAGMMFNVTWFAALTLVVSRSFSGGKMLTCWSVAETLAVA